MTEHKEMEQNETSEGKYGKIFFHIIKRLFYECYKPLYNNKMGFYGVENKVRQCLIKIPISCINILTLQNMKKSKRKEMMEMRQLLNVLGGGINIS